MPFDLDRFLSPRHNSSSISHTTRLSQLYYSPSLLLPLRPLPPPLPAPSSLGAIDNDYKTTAPPNPHQRWQLLRRLRRLLPPHSPSLSLHRLLTCPWMTKSSTLPNAKRHVERFLLVQSSQRYVPYITHHQLLRHRTCLALLPRTTILFKTRERVAI